MQVVKTAVYTFYNIENPRDVSGRRQLNLSGGGDNFICRGQLDQYQI